MTLVVPPFKEAGVKGLKTGKAGGRDRLKAITTSARITEKAFMGQVIQLARLMGWLVYHTHDSRRSVAGFPDLLLIRRGEMLVAELKVGKNEASEEQLRWLNAFRGANVREFLWYPSDWDEIERTLA